MSIEQNVLFEAVTAYLGVIRETENVSLRENNLSVISEELRAANDRFEVGEITKTDVALAEARLAASNSALAVAKGSYEKAVASYISAIGEKPGSLEYPNFCSRSAKFFRKRNCHCTYRTSIDRRIKEFN